MSYAHQLPAVFPYGVGMPPDLIHSCVHILLETDERWPNGSSFAITADAREPGWQHLWLSQASRNRLAEVSETLAEVLQPIK